MFFHPFSCTSNEIKNEHNMQIKVKHLIEKAVKYKKDSNPNALKRKEPYLCLSPFEVGVKRGEEVEALMA